MTYSDIYGDGEIHGDGDGKGDDPAIEPPEPTEDGDSDGDGEPCPECDGNGYTCKGACFGKPTCDGSPCPRGCEPEGLMAGAVRSIREGRV